MTSFSSSSTARPTGRLLCSACRLGIMGSRPLASVTRRVLVPPPRPRRGPPRTPARPQPQDRVLHCVGVHAPSQGPGPASELCGGQTDGRGPRHALLLEAGRLWTSLRHPQGPLSLGAPWCLREEPGGPPRAGRPSPLKCVRILPLAKAEGSAIHCPPPAPQLHARRPRLPEDKGLHCLHTPTPTPGLAPHLLPWPV